VNTDSELQIFRGCQILNGNFAFRGVSSLGLLSSLVTVNGHFQVSESPNLSSLAGLEKLQHVEGISIDYNPALTSVAALRSLISAPQAVGISHSPVVSLVGIGGITETKDFTIRDTSIVNLEGVEVLRTSESFNVLDNAFLETFNGTESLLSVGTDLFIINNPRLIDLSGLSSLTSVGDRVAVVRNPLLDQCWADELAVRTGGVCDCSQNYGVGGCQ
jgi:hypothetical protein